MIARIPMNTNEDAISLNNFDTKIQVRHSSRINSINDNNINNGGSSILGGARHKLSRLSRFNKRQDSETGGINEFNFEINKNDEKNNEEYIFNRSSIIKGNESINFFFF